MKPLSASSFISSHSCLPVPVSLAEPTGCLEDFLVGGSWAWLRFLVSAQPFSPASIPRDLIVYLARSAGTLGCLLSV
jgi:hypothetical protein